MKDCNTLADKILEDTHGIIAWRAWIMDRGSLRSWFISSYKWEGLTQYMPNKNFESPSGFHAYALSRVVFERHVGFWCYLDSAFDRGSYATVVGIVELRGKIYEHEDGVIRAEWLRMLSLHPVGEKRARPLLRNGLFKEIITPLSSRKEFENLLSIIASKREVNYECQHTYYQNT